MALTDPVLLDLCCCEGGAAKGYQQAGFEVLGADIKDIRRYPGRFIKGDALAVLDLYRDKVDAVHASPPCQRYSQGTTSADRRKYPDMVSAVRAALIETGLPWVIENVPRAPLIDPLVLCGTQFRLRTTDDDGTMLWLKRHRHFESNVRLTSPGLCRHPRGRQWAGSYGGARDDKVEAREVRGGGYVPRPEVIARLLDIDWMSKNGLYQAVPPAYTYWIGHQLMGAVRTYDSPVPGGVGGACAKLRGESHPTEPRWDYATAQGRT